MKSMLFAIVLSVLLVSSEQLSIKSSNASAIKNQQHSTFIDDYDVATSDQIKGVPKLFELEPGEERELYYYEQIVIVRDLLKQQSKTIRCEIVEVYEEQEAAEVIKALELSWNLTGISIKMDKTIRLMSDCDALDANAEKVVELDEEELLKQLEKEDTDADFKSWLVSVVVPGTKWCGFGDTAENYHDLGFFRNTDRCCRAHDLCPIKVLSKDVRYDLNNEAKYTKSHCICDEAFYTCLKSNNELIDKIIGNTYFNIVKPECIKGLPEFPEEKMKFIKATRTW